MMSRLRNTVKTAAEVEDLASLRAISDKISPDELRIDMQNDGRISKVWLIDDLRNEPVLIWTHPVIVDRAARTIQSAFWKTYYTDVVGNHMSLAQNMFSSRAIPRQRKVKLNKQVYDSRYLVEFAKHRHPLPLIVPHSRRIVTLAEWQRILTRASR